MSKKQIQDIEPELMQKFNEFIQKELDKKYANTIKNSTVATAIATGFMAAAIICQCFIGMKEIKSQEKLLLPIQQELSILEHHIQEHQLVIETLLKRDENKCNNTNAKTKK